MSNRKLGFSDDADTDYATIDRFYLKNMKCNTEIAVLKLEA